MLLQERLLHFIHPQKQKHFAVTMHRKARSMNQTQAQQLWWQTAELCTHQALPMQSSTAHPVLLQRHKRAPGAKPEARQSRAYRRLECHRPERNGLALVKLKATTGNEQVHRYPTGICAWAYLFHSVAILKDSHENLAQTDRWPELRVPSHHPAALKGDPGTCTLLATHLGRDRPGSADG